MQNTVESKNLKSIFQEKIFKIILVNKKKMNELMNNIRWSTTLQQYLLVNRILVLIFFFF